MNALQESSYVLYEDWIIEFTNGIVTGALEKDEILYQKGCCSECRDGQLGLLDRKWGEGHFLCSWVPDFILRMDFLGAVEPVLEMDGWHYSLDIPKANRRYYKEIRAFLEGLATESAVVCRAYPSRNM